MYDLEAAKAKKAADATPTAVLAITKDGLASDAADTGIATFYGGQTQAVAGLYTETVVCVATAVDTSAKLAKCLDDAYYVADALRRHVGYSTGTTFNVDVLQYQKWYATDLSFNPMKDIKTETSIDVDPAAVVINKLLHVGGWYHESYHTHPIQFFSVIDMILVEDWATLKDTGSDILKKLFVDDMIDSVRLQEVITKAREYADFVADSAVTAATVNANAAISGSSLSTTKTP